jgi:cyanophycin synthetase
MTESELGKIEIIAGPLVIENFKVLYGANYFSGNQVIRFRINLNQYGEIKTNQIQDFLDKLASLIPSLYHHHCSPGRPGGFFERVAEGTLLGHVMEHVAIELQTLAGMDVGFGKTRSTKQEGVYNVVFRFFDQIAGVYAGKAAINIINSILNNSPINIENIIADLVQIREKRLLGYSTQAIVDEAAKRNIPYLRLDKYNMVQLGTGKYRKIIRATITGKTSLIAVETTDNKYLTNSILKELGVPVPRRIVTSDVAEVIHFQKHIQKPIVIKPIVGSKGKRISIGLQSESTIREAFKWAFEIDNDVIAQEFIEGDSYRVLIIDNKFAAAVRLQPPFVIGNGIDTIEHLIAQINLEEGRQIGEKGKLAMVEIDEDTLKILELKGYHLQSILAEGEKLVLKNSENLRLGGKSFDVSEVINPYNIFVCERISKILHIDVAGIDIISKDISKALNENDACIIEVNSAPDFKMHIEPTEGEKREVQKLFLDMLFPRKMKTQVPIVSITGSHGKTMLANLLHFCLKMNGLKIGLLNSNGLYIDGFQIKKDDLINSRNHGIILKDPTIDCAIFEVPVETILEFGIAYEYAGIGIVLNLDESKKEYYEYDHIRDIDDIAYAKSVVAEQVLDSGYSILNIDNKLIFEMTERLYNKAFFISSNPMNPNLIKHLQKKGKSVVMDTDGIVLYESGNRHLVFSLAETHALLPRFDNLPEVLMSAIAGLHIFKISVSEIQNSINLFSNVIK